MTKTQQRVLNDKGVSVDGGVQLDITRKAAELASLCRKKGVVTLSCKIEGLIDGVLGRVTFKALRK